MRWLSVLALPLAACASAGGGSGPADGPAGDLDAPAGGEDAAIEVDAPPMPDAPPTPTLLSQNINTVPNGTVLGCNQSNYTRENSYYRVFTLADHGVAGSYEVQSVTFAVNSANAGGTQQPAQVKIGRYTGTPGGLTLSVADITPIAAVAIQIPDGATSVTTPISGVLPPGSHLIVELAVPDGLAAQNRLFIGTNAAGEAKPGYIRAPTCGTAAPTSMNYVGQQNSPPIAKTDLIMTVNGVRY